MFDTEISRKSSKACKPITIIHYLKLTLLRFQITCGFQRVMIMILLWFYDFSYRVKLSKTLWKIISVFFFLFFPFLATPWHREFPGHGSDPRCSCNLSHSCGNNGSLSHCAGLGIERAFRCSQDSTDPIVPTAGTPKIISCSMK